MRAVLSRAAVSRVRNIEILLSVCHSVLSYDETNASI